MKYSREKMVVALVLLVLSELLVGINTAPTTGDEQTSFTTAIGAEEDGSNRYTYSWPGSKMRPGENHEEAHNQMNQGDQNLEQRQQLHLSRGQTPAH